MYHKVILVSLLSLHASNDLQSSKYPGQEIESASHFHATNCFMGMPQVPNLSPAPADTEWIDSLNQIPLPDSIQTDDFINVYFKYNKLICGYEVTARWMPFDPHSETGYVVMNFRNSKNGTSFQYVNFEKYNNSSTDEVTFSENFKGHRNGDIYYFDYPAPETELRGGLYQLGYVTPFQLLDVDFDGVRELLVSDWAQTKGGNHYAVYKIKESGLELMTCSPLNRLTTDSKLNPQAKTISLFYEDGAYNAAEFFFSLKKSNRKETNSFSLPKWCSDMLAGLDKSPFTFDSVRIFDHSSFRTFRK